jgi:hypothetical protein
MRFLLVLFFTLVSTVSHAAMLVVNVYQPLPGKALLTASYMQEAQTILRGMGYQASFSNDLSGVYRFNMYFEDWESYGEMYQRLGSSMAWAAFNAKVSASPSATQVDNLLLNEVKAGPAAQPGMVAETTVWTTTFQGRNAFIESAMGAAPLHEKQGAAGVSIWADAFNVYYVTHHQNMQAFGRFRDTPNPEFQQYFAAASQNSTAVMERQTVMVTGQ